MYITSQHQYINMGPGPLGGGVFCPTGKEFSTYLTVTIGNLDIGAQVMSNTCYLISLRH